METTVEDIKAQYSMRDILGMYGMVPNRSGFIVCPFHKEKTASMKIYPSSFYCFGCHTGGDIFDFVRKMEQCDFKTAFQKLGGSYSGHGMSDAAILRMKRAENERKRKERILQQARDNYSSACCRIREAETALAAKEPMTDEWCDIQNSLVALRAAADQALETLLDLQKKGDG